MGIFSDITKEIQKRIVKDANRKATFGNIRPIIHSEINGKRIVAVGNILTASDRWKTFHDFLFDYIWHVFGKEWVKSQEHLPLPLQHIIFQWFRAERQFTERQKANDAGIIQAEPNGPTNALLLLAYDLYTVNHNSNLPNRLLDRMKNNGQYQGARYELFCMAALLRAGFTLSFEDESDGTRSHPELIATHKKSGIQIAVEAKSKHRPGALSTPGEARSASEIRLGKIAQLINDAVNKKVALPLVVFIDVNLPPDQADQILGTFPTKKTIRIFDSITQEEGKFDLFNFVLFTNHPHHYGREDQPDPKRIYSGVFSLKPKYRIERKEVIDDLVTGAIQYGHVPQTFDASP